MAKSKTSPDRQMLVHLNGTTQMTDQDVNKLALGEIAVNHGVKPELYTVYTDSANTEHIARFVDEAAVDAKIANLNIEQYALSATVEGYQAENDRRLDALEAISGQSHTHENKALLDTYTQTEADLADAVAKKHEHANMEVLTGITAEKVSAWDAAEQNAKNYTDTEVAAASGNAITSANSYTDAAKAEVIGQTGDTATANTIYGAKAYAESIVESSITAATGDTLVIASADGKTIKVGASEDLSDAVAKKHEHANMEVLTGITAEKVSAWDAAEQNAKDYTDDALNAYYTSAQTDTKIANASGNAITSANSYTDTAKSELIGDMTGDTKTLGALQDAIEALDSKAVVTVEKLGTPSSSAYAASYVVKQNGVQVGTAIDIPKDYLVKSATIEVCQTADTPVAGLQPGDKYIDFVVNAKDGQGEESHIYLPIADLAHVYKAGNGINIDNSDVISAVVDTNNANGLSVGANGIAMALATSGASGAMSAADKAKLDGIASGAQANVIETVKVNGTDLTVTDKAVDITMPTKLTDLTNDGNFVQDASYVHTDNNYTTAEKEKLAAIEADADVNVIEGVQVNGDDLTPDASKKVNVTIAEGTANGTIKVNGTDVNVHGLGSAAYSAATDFDLAGAAADAKAEVIGQSGDASTADTIYGAKAYAESLVDEKNVTASGDSYVSATASNNHVVVAATTGTVSAGQDVLATASDVKSYVGTVSGNIESAITNEITARTQADEALDARIDALEAISGQTQSALQGIDHGTDGDYVTTTVGAKDSNNHQSVGVAVTVVAVSAATGTNKGLAEASDVKAYVDDAVSGKNVEASGDNTYINASANNNAVSVSAITTTLTGTSEGIVTAAEIRTLVRGVDTTDQNHSANVQVTSDKKLDFSNMIIDCGTY